MMTCLTRLLPALLLCTAPLLNVQAQTPPMLPAWDQLTPQQRDVLIAALRQRWNDLPEEREKIYRHSQRWIDMNAEQRQQALTGMDRYRHMSPEQRHEAMALFQRMRTLSPPERDALRERWHAMTPAERNAWLQAHPPADE